MLEITPDKIAHVILRARDIDLCHRAAFVAAPVALQIALGGHLVDPGLIQ